MDGAVRDTARDPALPRPRGRPFRPAPRHPVSDPLVAAAPSTTSADLDGRHDSGATTRPRRTRHGHRLPVDARKCPMFPGLETLRRASGSTRRAGPRSGVDFTGRRVGVIGTGSTGDPARSRARAAGAHSYVFQRTPNYSMPAQNRPLAPDGARGQGVLPRAAAPWRELVAACRAAARRAAPADGRRRGAPSACTRTRWARGGIDFARRAFTDLFTATRRERHGAPSSCARKIREIVSDPAVAEKLCAAAPPIGTKRPCVDTGYYETFNRDNVDAGRPPQRRRSRRSRRDGIRTARRASTSSTPSSSPPASTR